MSALLSSTLQEFPEFLLNPLVRVALKERIAVSFALASRVIDLAQQ